ncbi:TetR family transcriptional regulator [uncultured Massilia sp.]|uniref:TetR family transcriptional regulator n=1 Tax=uncultured Massilia sp. TaxID=169973 RepID=UPI0025E17B2D|nr:TetR family transcriptional regulator [uncultured Massilia sp.]
MATTTRRTRRGESSLSRAAIIDAAIALLDAGGEAGLTFRALAQKLATGAGAIYWHVADKDDLLDAACDAIVAAAIATAAEGATARARIRAVGLGLFDAIDAHPWVGAELARSPARMPMLRIFESLGRPVRELGVPAPALWLATSTLLNTILGVAGQNAANRRLARERGLASRAAYLDSVAAAWARLDAEAFPFTRGMGEQLRTHDDREDFAAGIDLILDGIGMLGRADAGTAPVPGGHGVPALREDATPPAGTAPRRPPA